uniref:Lipocalin/cytosolic fatty-acid binding domain-containing protein n=1 Tax=Oncorhynchus tshawytscha TaxID=74940 RepID=A0AAZ3RP09_ONCTS
MQIMSVLVPGNVFTLTMCLSKRVCSLSLCVYHYCVFPLCVCVYACMCVFVRVQGVNVMLRKIAVAAASKPSVEITQEGETLSIRTFTSVRTTHVTFTVGESFNEATVDGRPCTSLPKWETDSKISCVQTLQKGEGPKTAWTREITNDGELILTMSADDVVCTRVYVRE